jgi:ABC-type transport system substrate-binding protein
MEFNATKSSGYMSEARKALKNIGPLKLSYPAGDPITEMACAEIKNQLASALSLEIVLDKVSPPEAFPAMLDAGAFDLAYWRHDFKDQTYWLWPLLDPRGIGPGGPNFMRYYQDKDLQELFTQLNSHKQFPQIQKLTHNVHRHVFENAIVIPLWQLDTYVAVDEALENVRLDPWVLYGNVEEWDLPLRTR